MKEDEWHLKLRNCLQVLEWRQIVASQMFVKMLEEGYKGFSK